MDLLLPGVGLLVWTLLAFLIVFFILKKFAWGIIIKSLSEREQGITDALDTAKKVKADQRSQRASQGRSSQDCNRCTGSHSSPENGGTDRYQEPDWKHGN